MSEIVILDSFPIILTKDSDWEYIWSVMEGSIIRLPEDAVLIVPPTTKSLTVDKEKE